MEDVHTTQTHFADWDERISEKEWLDMLDQAQSLIINAHVRFLGPVSFGDFAKAIAKYHKDWAAVIEAEGFEEVGS